MEPLTSAGWAALHAMPFPEPTEEQLRAICERHGRPARGPFGRLPSTGVINTIVTIGDGLLLRLPKDAPEGWRDTLTESVAVPAADARPRHRTGPRRLPRGAHAGPDETLADRVAWDRLVHRLRMAVSG